MIRLPYNVILASNSPRRQELLKGLDIDFKVKVIPNLSEDYPIELKGKQIPEFLANQKAQAYNSILDDKTLIITADTIVWRDNKVYEKPKDREDAIRILNELSGGTHDVITGVCLLTAKSKTIFSATSKVTFSTLSSEEIEYYIDKYKPFDKAGSYGVQEWIGYIAVEKLEGSFYNVMGLPIQKLYSELKLISQDILQ